LILTVRGVARRGKINSNTVREIWATRRKELPSVAESRTGSCRYRRAFTLIEVLVSVAILSIGIVVVLQAFNTAAVALSGSRTVTRASLLIEDKLGNLSLDAERGKLETGYMSGRFDDPFGNYRWRTRVEEASEVARGDLRTVSYRVEITAIEDTTGRETTAVTFLGTTEKDGGEE
jgi:prepilin-type N-terminal cleavage/methylation domain-containing protein